MRYIVLMALVIALAGCSTLKNAFKSNAEVLAAMAPGLTQQACDPAAKSLQPHENALVCAGLNGCAKAFCAPQ